MAEATGAGGTVPRGVDRRAFLRRAAVAAASLGVGGATLAACDRSGAPRPSIALNASPHGPTFQAPAVKGATLRIYEWKDYLAQDVLRSFERSMAGRDVRVDVESFLHIDEAVARLQDPATDFDIFFPTIDVLDGLVGEGLLLPLDHASLPNLKNLWPWFADPGGPFYDPGQRYTIPYTVYSSGIGWRADLVHPTDAPDAIADPFAILWDARYRGKLGMYDDYLEALSLALLRDGVRDVRTATEAQLRTAADALGRAVREAGVRFTDDGAEEGLPEGTFVAHQAWSGDVLTAPRYAREDGLPDVTAQLRYWSPSGAGTIVGCDLTAVCARGKHPELAHAFLNHLLDFPVAMDNFSWNGYQPPVTGLTRSAFADASFPWRAAVPPNLLDTLIAPEDFAAGQMLVGFGPSERARWLAQWKRVPAGA